MYQLINESNLSEARGRGISKDGMPEAALKAKETEAKASYLESFLLGMFLSPVVQQADGFQRNPTIFPCSRGLKTIASQCLLTWNETTYYLICWHGHLQPADPLEFIFILCFSFKWDLNYDK